MIGCGGRSIEVGRKVGSDNKEAFSQNSGDEIEIDMGCMLRSLFHFHRGCKLPELKPLKYVQLMSFF